MATTTFTDYQTIIAAAWLNDVNAATYNAGTPVTAAGVQAQIAAANTSIGTLNTEVAQLAGKNVIVNGDISISQLNGTALVTPVTTSFPIDMIYYLTSQPSKLQVQQVTTKLNSLGATTSASWSVLASYVPSAIDTFTCAFAIEGYNFARFQWGTANAKPASLQFKASATNAGTYSGVINNPNTTRSYPFQFTLAANVDTLVQIPNIPGDTGGTWLGGSNAACKIYFDLGCGSNLKGPAGAWSSTNYYGVTGATNFVSQANGSLYNISDVQFEVGSVCTTFERKLYSQNLLDSQRYLQTYTGSSNVFLSCTCAFNATAGFGKWMLPLPMRAAPTNSILNNPLVVIAPGGANSGGTANLASLSANEIQTSFSGSTGLTTGSLINFNYGASGSLVVLSAQI